MVYQIIKKVISYLIIATIFITGDPVETSGFGFYWYYVIYILFAAYGLVAYHKINRPALLSLLVVTAYSLITYQYGLDLVMKQVLNIAFVLLVFYNFIVFEDYDYTGIFRKYVNFSKVVLIIGFVQVIMYMAGSGDLYLKIFPFLAESNISSRLQSVTQEPSVIANTFAPIVLLSLYNLLHRQPILINKIWSVLFIAGYILTFSSVAYIGALLIIVILYVRNFTVRKVFTGAFTLTGLLIVSFTMYWFVPEVKLRVNDTMFAIARGINENNNYRHVNYSTYALLSNAYVAKKSLKESFWTGHGLGTHEITYDRLMPPEMIEYQVLNREDANSMALRLLTETGFLGFTVFIFFVFRYKLRSRFSFTQEEKLYWIMNAGIFVMIVLILMRSGHYTIQGRILFLLLYYYSYCSVKHAKDSGNISHLPA